MEDESELKTVVIRVEHLGRTVNGREIVRDVSFDVIRGELLAVVGPSGAGKSSLLRMLNRLDEPSSGEVFVEGQKFREIAPRELRRRVGMVMQTAYLFPGTVAENLRFGPQQHGVTLSDEDVARLLKEVGLPEYATRTVENLSGGEAQRVSVARALANDPVVLLMDEPTSALDEEAKRGVEALIREIVKAKSLTCVMVTHDMAQAARIANRALVMRSGELKAIGPVEEVLHGK